MLRVAASSSATRSARRRTTARCCCVSWRAGCSGGGARIDGRRSLTARAVARTSNSCRSRSLAAPRSTASRCMRTCGIGRSSNSCCGMWSRGITTRERREPLHPAYPHEGLDDRVGDEDGEEISLVGGVERNWRGFEMPAALPAVVADPGRRRCRIGARRGSVGRCAGGADCCDECGFREAAGGGLVEVFSCSGSGTRRG